MRLFLLLSMPFLGCFCSEHPTQKTYFLIKADIWFIIILYSLLLVFGVISNLIVIITLLITLKKSILSKPSALYVMHMARFLFYF